MPRNRGCRFALRRIGTHIANVGHGDPIFSSACRPHGSFEVTASNARVTEMPRDCGELVLESNYDEKVGASSSGHLRKKGWWRLAGWKVLSVDSLRPLTRPQLSAVA
jgi:hypothetical protein